MQKWISGLPAPPELRADLGRGLLVQKLVLGTEIDHLSPEIDYLSAEIDSPEQFFV